MGLVYRHIVHRLLSSMEGQQLESLQDRLLDVNRRISKAHQEFLASHAVLPGQPDPRPPQLVAVSKMQPIERIIELYTLGQRHFGENYVQELHRKSNDDELTKACPDIRWHFVGRCQTSNASKLMKCRNLKVVETVDSAILADRLSKLCKLGSMLDVMIQVNTSEESSKNGITADKVIDLAEHISGKCPNLRVVGLMNIGSVANSTSCEAKDNPDHVLMCQIRQKLIDAQRGSCSVSDQLSMGMSADFENAIRLGSTSVRLGTCLFGPRPTPKAEN